MTGEKMQEMLGLAGAMVNTPKGAAWKLPCEDARSLGKMLIATFGALGDAGVKLEDLQAQLEERNCGLLRANENLAAKMDDLCKERDSCLREIDGLRKSVRVGDSAVLELRKVREEMDSLREQIQGPLVQFALELERMNKAAAQHVAGGVA